MNESGEKVVTTTCASHCGGTCVLKVHVKDGVIVRIDTDDGPEPQLRACLRGRAYRQRAYHPDRITTPLKRVGARGKGKFEPVTWDDALHMVSRELIRVRETYGPAAIAFAWAGGDINQIHNARLFHKVLCHNGGYTRLWGVWSYQGGIHAAQATYGTWRTSSARDDLLNSRLIILWGWNPTNTICGANTSWYLARAREAGARVIAIDPRFTDTAAVLADQWIPIRPGTDTAMLLAMAHVMLQENLQDQTFLDKHTVGLESFKDYLMGVEDGIAKTPQWAEAITGVSADTTWELARAYARTKPAAFICGIAPGRTAYGEQYHRAASTLAAMTGNVGVHGGEAAAKAWESASWYPYKMPYGYLARPQDGVNPVDPAATDGRIQLYVPSGVHYMDLADFILKGKAGGYATDPKLLFVVNHNYLNQTPNINKIVQALKKLEFMVVLEQSMTATAKFADIILPTAIFLERNDIDFGVGIPFYGCVNKAIEPAGQCKTHLDIARSLAACMGMTDFGEDTDVDLSRKDVAESEIPSYEEFRKKGVYRIELNEPYVPFRKQIEDPDNNRFGTPSGKIEIRSETLAQLRNPGIPPVAKYIEPWEGPRDPLAKRYPLQMITTHFKRRTHGQFENLPWLRELQRHTVQINSADAKTRGILNGDLVRVYNDRGAISIRATVTERILAGVIDVPQGTWYNPDANRLDRGGNPNTLIDDRTSPGGAFPYNTCLVEVEKVAGN